MKKFDLTRANPKRSKKRKDQRKGLKQIVVRITPELLTTLKQEAVVAKVSDSLYINAALESRNVSKIKKILGISTV